MTKRPLPFLYSLSIVFSIISCDPVDSGPPRQVEGYVPVYATNLAELKTITSTAPRTIINGGKLYTTGSLLFQVELDSGIHVINYADPQNPRKLAFIKSFLCKEVTEKSGFLYTNNLADLVVIDIRNLNDIKLVSRTENVFPDLITQSPPSNTVTHETTWFECPQEGKGIIVSWKKQTLTNPRCWK